VLRSPAAAMVRGCGADRANWVCRHVMGCRCRCRCVCLTAAEQERRSDYSDKYDDAGGVSESDGGLSDGGVASVSASASVADVPASDVKAAELAMAKRHDDVAMGWQVGALPCCWAASESRRVTVSLWLLQRRKDDVVTDVVLNAMLKKVGGVRRDVARGVFVRQRSA
jgi:hypothetical protein